MISLPNNCRCSELSVTPKDWDKPGADVKKRWCIHYRFYNFDGQVNHVFIRGMNYFKRLPERQAATRQLLSDTLNLLQNEGYNPITGHSIPPVSIEGEINPNTHFIKAITDVVEKLTCSEKTKIGIECDIDKICKAAKAMKFDRIPISEIRRKHIKLILEKVAQERKLTPGTYNHYRAHLMMVFTELEDMEAIEDNPVADIKKRHEIKKIRVTLTEDERKAVDKHLKASYYTFWRYLHIFFHSGSRTAELFRLQGKDVDLNNQTFKITVIKGKYKREVKKVIKDIVVPLWDEIMKECGPDQYVFARNLNLGDKPIDPEQVSKRWYKCVKKELGIKADFYSLKHAHSDSLAQLLSLEQAMKHNSHTSTKTTRIYAVGQSDRENEELKTLQNKFA